MSTKSRLKKLETVFAPKYMPKGWTPLGWSEEGEIERHIDEIDTIADLVGDDDLKNPIVKLLLDNAIEIIKTVRMPAFNDAYKQSLVPLLRRLPRASRLLLEHTPADLRAPMLTEDSLVWPLATETRRYRSPWLYRWIRAIADFDSWLPPTSSRRR